MPRGGKRPGAGRPKGSRDTLRVVPVDTIPCGECGVPLVCVGCSTGDITALSRLALSEVVRGVGGRGATARVTAALSVLSADYLANLTDGDMLAECKRRGLHVGEKRKPDLDAAEAAVLGGEHG